MINRILGIKNLKKICILFTFFLASCDEKIVEEKDFIIPQDNIEEQTKIKKPLDNIWYEKINITISKDANIIEIIKGIANRFNLKFVFNIKQNENINYSAKDKPLIEVLSDICDTLNWKLQIKGKNAKISEDTPYMHTYFVPFLIGERNGSSDSSFSGKPSAKGMEGSSGNINIGSSGSLSSVVNLNPFEELRKNLEMISENKESTNENDSDKNEKALKFSIHKQAGLLTIIAKQKVHKMVAKYINLLSKQMRNQILVEARIYEVELYETFATGIDWSKLINIPFMQGGLPILGSMGEKGELNINVISDPSTSLQKIEGNIISFLRKFGNVHSISNPRVMITNNNIAIFKVVDNHVFFKLTHQEKPYYNSNNNKNSETITTVSSEIHTIPVGVILLVQPSIDANGRITISLHPTISEVHKEIEDPALTILAKNMNGDGKMPSSKIPLVKTRELDTVFTTEENKTTIIGGLLYSKKSDTESGLPLSWFSGKKEKISTKREIVIAIKAKIIYAQENYDELVFVE